MAVPTSRAGLPLMVAAPLRRDLTAWALTAVSLGALEGGLLAVIVRNLFADNVAPLAVDLAVGVVAGAPALANVVSLWAATWAHGREKLPSIRALMVLMAACLLAMAVPPANAAGLVAFCVLAVLARMAWSGILTLRSAVWRANYPRHWRGRVAGRIAQLASVLMALTSAGIGWAMDWRLDAFRWLFPVAGACALAAAASYRRARQRRLGRLLRAERSASQVGAPGWRAMFRVLRHDLDFRRYMVAMMIFGSGNLMVVAILVLVLNGQFDMPRLQQVLITSSLPLVVLCFTTRLWGGLLDRGHIFRYRAVHSWFFVAAFACFAAASISGYAALFWPGAIILGLAFGGAFVGWNLGHNDFADDAHSALYMAIHVSLTGVRGGIAPLLGVAFYQLLERWQPDSGRYAMLLPLALSTAGALRFVWLARHHAGRPVEAGS